jgi:hypothetical protein
VSERKVTDEQIIDALAKYGTKPGARILKITPRTMQQRCRAIERRTGQKLRSPIPPGDPGRITQKPRTPIPGRIQLDIDSGIVLIGGDCHYWPGDPSLMHRAFVRFCKDLKPKVVIMNGDVVDLASISRHPPIGWTKLPKVADEIKTAQERLGEIEAAAFRARKIWSLGNHDSRYETRIATVAEELEGVPGTSLKDHYPLWEPCWSVFLNDDIVVKHRFKGGQHAPTNNALWAGRTVITGHLHSAKVSPISDYNGDRWGVDTGCIADPNHRAFVDYTEDGPKNWRDGFCVLTFHKGRLLPPELVSRWDEDSIVFRGTITGV